MPTRKNQTKSTTAKAAAPAQKNSVADHAHASLEASVAELKKEVESLRGQCHSCCAELSELLQLKSSVAEINEDVLKLKNESSKPLSANNQPSEGEKVTISRLNKLISGIRQSQNMGSLRVFIKKNLLN